MKRRLALCFGAWFVCVVALPTFGHPMAVTRGSAVVTDETLTLTLVIPAEDLLHMRSLSTSAEGLYDIEEVRRTAAAYGQSLRRRIVVRDARGEVIDGRVESWALDHSDGRSLDFESIRQFRVHYTLGFNLGTDNEYLSFQQVARYTDVVAPSSIVLAVRYEDTPLRSIRMTGRGNVEVVRLASMRGKRPAEESGCHTNAFLQSEANRTIRTIVRIHDSGVRLDVYIPVRLLESWVPLERAQRDFLSPTEQARCHEQLTHVVTAQNPTFIDGERTVSKQVDIQFLDVGELDGEVTQSPRRLSTWTTRVRIRVDYETLAHARTVDMKWTMFNASMLVNHALVVVDDECLERDLTTYNPHLTWTAD